MIPTYELTGESFNISGRGTVFTAILTCDCEREDLCQLLGQSINNQMIIGIESFAIPSQRKGMGIGFLVQKENIKMGKEKFTISWIMLGAEKMIKFKEADEAYDLTDSVVALIEKNGLDKKEGIEVEAEIDKSEGDGTVTFLSEVGGTTTEEPVAEEKETKDETSTEETKETEEDLEVKTLTVSGVSVPNKGVTFKEEKAVWYTLDDSINVQEFKDKYTKKTVEVSIRKTKGDEKNDIITAFTPLAESEPTDTSDENPEGEPKKSSSAYQRSIESQACMKSAYNIVASMVDSSTPDDKVKDLITLIAEHSYVTLQNLKNKE